MMSFHEAYIALGSNLGDPRAHILQAFIELGELELSELICTSSLYQTPPLGPQDQNDYINAVVKIKTQLAPLPLLQQLLNIEKMHGRERRVRWGARTLDCDLLLYGDIELHEPDLTLPHPEMTRRAFVLLPLGEIAPDLFIHGKTVSDYLRTIDCVGIKKINYQEDMYSL